MSAQLQQPTLIISDIDNTLTGSHDAIGRLADFLSTRDMLLAVASGRSLPSTRQALAAWGIEEPQLMITSVGAEIYYNGRLWQEWERHLDHGWNRAALQATLSSIHAMHLQPDEEQRPHKLSYYLDPGSVNGDTVRRVLRAAGHKANVIVSHGSYLDILPARADKGKAVNFCIQRFGFDRSRVLVAGDSGNDIDMLTLPTPAVVVGNHTSEVEFLRTRPDVYFAVSHHADAIVEGAVHFGL